tara:strand:- start:3891 stop:4109 length:219 start_codon:yes stop_codon:yes gene_type:complete
LQQDPIIYTIPKFTGDLNMDTEATTRQRKSLAVDQKTYDMLQEICFEERRTRIEQLKILIEKEHKRIISGAE